MKHILTEKENVRQKYDTVIAGAGAAGLYCACALDKKKEGVLILEKTRRPGTKLLMSGSGQCNITHGGSIKDFVFHYGDNGSRIRGMIQKYNNLHLQRFFEDRGVRLYTREDGKMFPQSMKAADILNTLLNGVKRKGIEIILGAEASRIDKIRENEAEDTTENNSYRYAVYTDNRVFLCRNLVIATGGCSYPSTGSDGKMLSVLSRDLDIKIVHARPALAPVYVNDYPFGELSGISFENIQMELRDSMDKRMRKFQGDILFTEKGFSGPAILNNSRYMETGMKLCINFSGLPSASHGVGIFKAEFSGRNILAQTYLSEKLDFPRRFSSKVCRILKIDDRKVSSLSGSEIKKLADFITEAPFIIKKTGDFSEAMATCGGVVLDDETSRGRSHSRHEGLYFAGEVLDIDGDTGGYNLQFAYSSAMAVAASINSSEI